jgi:predicted NBD/HSP70 family sugar kinase
VHSAPNLGWHDLELQRRVAEASGCSVIVSNDANAAVLAEHGFGHAESDLMLVRIGHGVGAGLLLGGIAIYGSRFAAGEIGHVTVGTDGGPLCACGKTACLEAWVAIPRLEAEIQAIRADSADDDAAATRIDQLLRDAGERLGIALAPVVGALDLSQIVLSGPEELLDGALAQATVETLRNRTMAEFHGDLTLRLTTLGQDIVLRGAAVMVLSSQLGVS